MRVLAKRADAHVPGPSISTVVVPSGEAAVTVPAWPGSSDELLQELEQAGGELQLLGDAGHHEARARRPAGRAATVVGAW